MATPYKETLALGIGSSTSAYRITALREIPSAPTSQPDIKIYFETSTAIDHVTPNDWILEKVGGHVIMAVNTSGADKVSYIWDGTFFQNGSGVTASAALSTVLNIVGGSFSTRLQSWRYIFNSQPVAGDLFKVGAETFEFVSGTVGSAVLNEVLIGTSIAATVINLASSINSRVATCRATAHADTTSLGIGTSGSDNQYFNIMVINGSPEISLSSFVPFVERPVPGNFININGESSGGVDSTGWYRISGLNLASQILLHTARPSTTIASDSPATYKIAMFQPYDPLNLNWEITAVGFSKGRTLVGAYSPSDQNAYLYISDVNDPKSMLSSAVFIVGDVGERILKILDDGENILISKEFSQWEFLLNGPDPLYSSLQVLDPYKGIMNNQCAVKTPYGIVVLTHRDGFFVKAGSSWQALQVPLSQRININDCDMKKACLTYKDERLILAIPNMV